jgi:hypothetical protein
MLIINRSNVRSPLVQKKTIGGRKFVRADGVFIPGLLKATYNGVTVHWGYNDPR